MTKSPALTAIKGYRDGRVGVRVLVHGGGSFGRDDVRVTATTYLTTAEAREFAAGLIQRADDEDARMAKKQAAEDRRRAWRDREVAAGRMKVISFRSAF